MSLLLFPPLLCALSLATPFQESHSRRMERLLTFMIAWLNVQARIDIFDFVPECNTTAGGSGAEGCGFESSGFVGSGSIQNLIGMTNVSSENILSLGELGLVSVLSFEQVVREDTANYTCTAVNEFPEATMIINVSNPLPLVVLGEWLRLSYPLYTAI